MKVLNLYAGIGGNRKLWTDVEVTAVELNPDIAAIYQDFFPDDKVVVGDAHQYLLDHFKEYDFIWSSPPCPSHSGVRRCRVHGGQINAVYPEMTLYQEIILLQHFAKCNWIVENVIPYYKPLIPAKAELHRHLFWGNFHLYPVPVKDDRKHDDVKSDSTVYGFNISKYDIKNKRQIMRNLVNPILGEYILNCARNIQPEINYGLFGDDTEKPS